MNSLEKIKGFYYNKNLVLILIIFYLTWYLPTATVDHLSDPILLKKWMSRAYMSLA